MAAHLCLAGSLPFGLVLSCDLLLELVAEMLGDLLISICI